MLNLFEPKQSGMYRREERRLVKQLQLTLPGASRKGRGRSKSIRTLSFRPITFMGIDKALKSASFFHEFSLGVGYRPLTLST
jgi:hypothetical protein